MAEYIEQGKFLEQPAECIFGGGVCGYPIDDCQNCPAHPDSCDPYWGMTKAVIC